MQINSYSRLSSVLDYLDDDKNDNSIEAILTANSNYRTAVMRQKLGIDDTASGAGSSKTIITAAQSAAAALDKMLSTADDSVFAKAEKDNSDTALTEAVTEVQSFITGYNSLVKNMSSQGGKVNITYLVELGKAYIDNEDELNSLGITRGDDGLLSVDTDKLKTAELASLKSAFYGDDSYASDVSKTIASIRKVTGTAAGMSSLYSSNYGSDATTADMTSSLLDSLFNSKA